MFGILNSTQIYGVQSPSNPTATLTLSDPTINCNTKTNKFYQRPRSTSSLSDSVRESKFFGIKSPTIFVEKFLKTELLNSYDSLKSYKNFHQNTTHNTNKKANRNSYSEGILNNFNCLQGSYRSNSDSEFYEAINVITTQKAPEMTIKCSKNLLAEHAEVQAPATLQNYQKLSNYENDGYTASPEVIQLPSSGASSGEFNGELRNNLAIPTSSGNSFYKRLSFGGNRNNSNSKHLDIVAQLQANESASDNSSSSIMTTTTTNSSTSTTTTKSNDLQRTSSASSSGDRVTASRERKCKSSNLQDFLPPSSAINIVSTPERIHRRKLIQLISNYEQQNKQLQRELVKEKRRRSEELSRVVKSLLCFESKLKTDMKTVNQRLADKDNEICRLVRQNRALCKKLAALKQQEKEKVCDEGVVVGDGEAHDIISDEDEQGQLMEDCLVQEALQCINCRKQFYDIELKEESTQTSAKDGSRKNADHVLEHGSSSDETVSSSFCGARRSTRYTSKRTSGTFRDYMRSRSMNIDDPSLEQNSEENTSIVSRDDSQTSYEKVNVYSRTIERMHGVKCESEQESSELSGIEVSKDNRKKATGKSISEEATFEEDDGIFSPTQDDDFEEEQQSAPPAVSKSRTLKVVPRRAPEFSEASPKQIYETSTDDWYASASDQEEIVCGRTNVVAKTSYGQGAVNPVLECVNQILLQQSMDETVVLRERSNDQSSTPQRSQNVHTTTTNLPRRSSLSGRRISNEIDNGDPNNSRNGTFTRKRVHFSTKNSMVHVPRNDEADDDGEDDKNIELEMKTISPSFHTHRNVIANEATVEAFNYESIYSNEYEPVGSERNSSNLYVDMECAAKLLDQKPTKKPPALPPKPANLMKFKKSLQQLDEMPDEQQDCESASNTAASEPDYCSISEVNVGITNVQIVAVVHKPPTCLAVDDELEAPMSEIDLEVSTINSDETFGAISHKTEEIEEIFADIPKLPNVAAIIAPKKQVKKHQMPQQNNDYLIMSPKAEMSNILTQNARLLPLNISSTATTTPHELLNKSLKSQNVESPAFKLQLPLGTTPPQHQKYQRKSMPNILAEINQGLHVTNKLTTPIANTQPSASQSKVKSSSKFEKTLSNSDIHTDLPIQAEFDWYNLDAEYGRSTSTSSAGSTLNQPDILKVNDHHHSNNGMLAEIHEDHESVTTAADEYNLDEEFSLTIEQHPDVLCTIPPEAEEFISPDYTKMENVKSEEKTNEAVNFSVYNENAPVAPAETKKIKKNLANFEKFIEGSGLSTKPLPSKRKIYFAGPYV